MSSHHPMIFSEFFFLYFNNSDSTPDSSYYGCMICLSTHGAMGIGKGHRYFVILILFYHRNIQDYSLKKILLSIIGSLYSTNFIATFHNVCDHYYYFAVIICFFRFFKLHLVSLERLPLGLKREDLSRCLGT